MNSISPIHAELKTREVHGAMEFLEAEVLTQVGMKLMLPALRGAVLSDSGHALSPNFPQLEQRHAVLQVGKNMKKKGEAICLWPYNMSVTMQNRSQCPTSLSYQFLQLELCGLLLCWVLYIQMYK